MTITISMWSVFAIVFIGTIVSRATSDLYDWWRKK